MKNPWIVVGLLAVILFGGAILYSNYVAGTVEDESVSVTKHIKGNPDSSVVLVEYSDFQCPACAQFQPVVTELLNLYGDQISFEYRHFPLINIHPQAKAAALAAEAAGQQGKFFEYHDILFTRQSEWSGTANANQLFVDYAAELELDTDRFRQQQRARALSDKVENDMRAGLLADVTGTPTFYLNGEKLELTTLASLIEHVEDALGIAPVDVPSTPDETTATPEPVDAAPTSDVRFGF